jgi:hypothetical protein
MTADGAVPFMGRFLVIVKLKVACGIAHRLPFSAGIASSVWELVVLSHDAA